MSDVAVVGGSITGSVAALLLKQAGFDVKVYEAIPQKVSQAGGVIGLDHVSLSVLEGLGIEQDEIVPFTSERVISIKVLNREMGNRVETIYPGRNTTWTLMHKAFSRRLTELEVPIEQGRRVKTLEEVEANIVIWADGRKSTGRTILDPSRTLNYVGYVAHRGQLNWCPPELTDFVRYEPGKTQFNMFPTDVGSDWTFYLKATLDEFANMFGEYPTKRTFVLPSQVTEKAIVTVNAEAAKLLPADVAKLIEGTQERMAAPVVETSPPDQMWWNVRGIYTMLLGDALAPVRPHTARGANNGIDQAFGLSQVMSQHKKYKANLEAGLNAWQAKHLPQVRSTLKLGTEMANRIGLS